MLSHTKKLDFRALAWDCDLGKWVRRKNALFKLGGGEYEAGVWIGPLERCEAIFDFEVIDLGDLQQEELDSGKERAPKPFFDIHGVTEQRSSSCHLEDAVLVTLRLRYWTSCGCRCLAGWSHSPFSFTSNTSRFGKAIQKVRAYYYSRCLQASSTEQPWDTLKWCIQTINTLNAQDIIGKNGDRVKEVRLQHSSLEAITTLSCQLRMFRNRRETSKRFNEDQESYC